LLIHRQAEGVSYQEHQEQLEQGEQPVLFHLLNLTIESKQDHQEKQGK
jgi:hypothetical protein